MALLAFDAACRREVSMQALKTDIGAAVGRHAIG